MHVAKPAADLEWRTIHSRVQALALESRAIDAEIGQWLLLASREGVHRKLGLSTFAEYADRMLGYDVHTTRERLRVAKALETLPFTRAALSAGRRTWSAIREITRVASPDNEASWIERTEGLTVREIEALVRGRAKGDGPTDARDPLLMPRRLVFELMPEDAALVMDAFERVRREVGMGATNVEVMRAMAEIVLGRRDARDAAYQVALTVCIGCGRTHQHAGGDRIEVPPEVADCARCDGKVVGFVVDDDDHDGASDAGHVAARSATGETASHVGRAPEVAVAAPPSGLDGEDAVADAGRAPAPLAGETASHVGRAPEVRSAPAGFVGEDGASVGRAPVPPLGGGTTSPVGRVPEVASPPSRFRGEDAAAHVGRPDGDATDAVEALRAAVEPHDRSARALLRAANRAFGRGRATVTPAMRRAVLARDQHRCVVPGCRCFRRVDLHHLAPRAKGGAHAIENLVTLCDSHHRLLHQGLLAIEVSPNRRVVVRHARGQLVGLRPVTS